MNQPSTQAVIAPDIAPAAEPQSIATVAAEIKAVIERHIALQDHEAQCLAYWVLHTYLATQRNTLAYVAIQSPEKRCGKTTLLNLLALMACRAVIASNITTGALFAIVDTVAPTLFIDEADTFLIGNNAMRGVINCGNTRQSAYVLRKVRSGKQNSNENGIARVNLEVKRYDCFCPKVIAMIGEVPDTIADRSIVIRLQRKLPSEKREPLLATEMNDLKSRCQRLAMDCAPLIAAAPKIAPEGLNDRAADAFDPLLAIAQLAGPEEYEKLLHAAREIHRTAEVTHPSPCLLLEVMLIIIDSGSDMMFTRDLTEHLAESDSWLNQTSINASSITARTLGKALARYGVNPTTIRIGSNVAKGYKLDEMKIALQRYVPRELVDRRLAEEREGRALKQTAREEQLKQEEEQAKSDQLKKKQELDQDIKDFIAHHGPVTTYSAGTAFLKMRNNRRKEAIRQLRLTQKT